ncbi:MAG: DHHA1 domain-containing protein [Gemmatimonadota bacterium]
MRPETVNVQFADVRTDYGATLTIMYYYLEAAGIDLSTRLATALLIGIKSDTRGLERESSEADLHAYLPIFPHADLSLLARIENPLIPRRHFEAFHSALERSVVHGQAVIADLGDADNPDLLAELADFLAPLEQAEYVLVMGRHKGRLYLSLRSRDETLDAGALITAIVGELGTAGGHGRMAGAQIDIGEDLVSIQEIVKGRFLSELGLDPASAGDPLIRDGDATTLCRPGSSTRSSTRPGGRLVNSGCGVNPPGWAWKMTKADRFGPSTIAATSSRPSPLKSPRAVRARSDDNRKSG